MHLRFFRPGRKIIKARNCCVVLIVPHFCFSDAFPFLPFCLSRVIYVVFTFQGYFHFRNTTVLYGKGAKLPNFRHVGRRVAFANTPCLCLPCWRYLRLRENWKVVRVTVQQIVATRFRTMQRWISDRPPRRFCRRPASRPCLGRSG